MPKVYVTQAQKEKEKLKKRIMAFLRFKMTLEGIGQKDIAQKLGLTQGAVSKMISSGSMTMIQFLRLVDLLKVEESDFKALIGG